MGSYKKKNIKGVSKHSWPKQVADALDLPLINCAIPGSSNREILWKILNTEITQTDLVLVHWTFNERDVIVGKARGDEPNYGLSMHYNDKINKFWWKYMTNRSHLDFNSVTAYMLANYHLRDKSKNYYNFFVNNYVMDDLGFGNRPLLRLNLNHPVRGCDGSHPSLAEYTKFAELVTRWLLTNDENLKSSQTK